VSLLLFGLTLSLFSNMSLIRAETEDEEHVNFTMASQGFGTFSSLDPIIWYATPDFDIISNVAEPLVRSTLTEDGSVEINPVLAESWIQVNDLTLDFILKEGASFTDGTPWNATSCKWNFDRLYNVLSDPWVWSKYTNLLNVPSDPFRTVTGVDLDWLPDGEYVYAINNTEVISEYRFRFNLNVPFDLTTIMLHYFGMISPVAHSEYFNAPLPDVWVSNHSEIVAEGLIGTGPFIFDEINFEDEVTTLTRNPDWWGPEPDIEILTYRYFGDDPQAMSIALVAGDIDGCQWGDKELIQNKEGIVYLEEAAIMRGSYTGMFPEKVDESVREALCYALDLDYYIDEILNVSAAYPTGAIFNGVSYQNDDIHPPRYDLNNARQILIDSGIAPSSASGWTDEDWKDVADGNGPVSPLSNYTLGYMDTTGYGQIAAMTKITARSIGINISLILEAENFWWILSDRIGAAETWDMFVAGMYTGPSVDQQFLFQYQNDAFFPDAMPVGGDAQVNEDVWNFLSTPVNDTETRQQYADAVADRINNELFVFLYYPDAPHTTGYLDKWTDIVSLSWFRPEYVKLQTAFGKFIGQIPGYSIIFLFISSSLVVTSLMRKNKK